EHKEGFDKLQLPAWSKDLPPERTLILLYAVPNAAAMRDSLHSIMQKRAGYLYVTNRGGGNPWDGLPAYWDEEVAAVKQLNEKRR
ncbi:MAG TPA: hypothetical protein VHB77_20335, partial [Planctomycetaceae bacterium]|nr:hypothetical protein [Planctomycetaceae bacterium]